jgi:hypothetical protein
MRLDLSAFVLAGAALAGALAGCVPGERMAPGRSQPQPRVAESPRDAYAARLAMTAHPADVQAWEDVSRRALRAGLAIAPSFRERVRLPADTPHAVAYRFAMAEGQTLHIGFALTPGATPLFADLFQVVGGEIFRPVESAPRGAR